MIMGHVWSKSRSLGQILGKPCVHFRGHICRSILMKHSENDCFDENSDEFENGSC